MSFDDFKKHAINLKTALVNFESVRQKSGRTNIHFLQSFESARAEALRKSLLTSFDLFKSSLKGLEEVYAPENRKVVDEVRQLAKQVELSNLVEAKDNVDKIIVLAEKIRGATVVEGFPKMPYVPLEIRQPVEQDFEEMQKCFDNSCYRSAIILCGRILETALHRKFYEKTENDLLEKSPGIGLGNLIARMEENGISLDPALGNQIHLINQVRIHSVHKKHDNFRPSRQQAFAVILYTMDVVGKLWG